jgi:hypothetical protein
MTERFCTLLACVDVGFIPDGILDDLPLPSRLGTTRVGGVDVNKPRTRATLNAVLALAAAPGGFTVTDLAGKVHTMTGHPGYTVRQAAYDLRKLRGKHLIDKPGRARPYHVPPPAAHTIAGLLTLREQVIASILAGIRSPRPGRKPKTWTQTVSLLERLSGGWQGRAVFVITACRRTGGCANRCCTRSTPLRSRVGVLDAVEDSFGAVSQCA